MLLLLVAALSFATVSSAQHVLADEPTATRQEPTTCTYTTYNWSTVEKKGVNHHKVEKAYADVSDDERSPEDPRCSVCSEDQRTVDVAALGFDGAGKVEVCWAYAEQLEAAFKAIKEAGDFDITALEGYRVGRTRGKVVDGLRTQLSNHSYGTAIDINAKQNGLYGSCDVSPVTEDALKGCKLRIGGKWRPSRNPRTTIVKGGSVYNAFAPFWKWGGEIAGKTRDMMHFSLTGY